LTRVCALIPAAGRGARFGGSENKVFAPLLGRPLLGWTLEAFAACEAVDDIVLIGSEADLPRLREAGEQFGGGKIREVVPGGADRQASVAAGLAACQGAEFIAAHDGARPCITPNLISVACANAMHFGATTVAVALVDSLVRRSAPNLAGESVARDALWAVQTPQVFRSEILVEAHERAEKDGVRGTDDAGLVRRLGREVRLTPGSPENLKVTRPEDLELAEAILARRHNTAAMTSTLRIGHGYDVHQLAEGRKLFLGGVEFPDAPRGLLGHSDADVLLHAVCDALLGAAGLGDIGTWFPPSDLAHKDRSSVEFLREVRARLDAEGYHVANVDVTVLAEVPKIGPRAEAMKQIIADTLKITSGQVGIKATTNETMGFVGRGEGIAVHAVALIYR